MELSKLFSVIEEKQALVKKIQGLIQLKASKDESYLHPRDVELEKFLKEGIDLCEIHASSLSSSHKTTNT